MPLSKSTETRGGLGETLRAGGEVRRENFSASGNRAGGVGHLPEFLAVDASLSQICIPSFRF